MVNKKGFLKIAEASVAILIIFSALLLITSHREERTGEDLSEILAPVLEEMAQNSSLRGEILNYDVQDTEALQNIQIIDDLEEFIGTRITNSALNYSAGICGLEESCYTNYPPDARGNLYSAERVISTNITEKNFSPKKVKIFLWRKESAR